MVFILLFIFFVTSIVNVRGDCKLDPHPSLEYQCKVPGADDFSVCNASVPDGTIAKPECRTPDYYSPYTFGFMNCNDDRWDDFVKCQLDCGKVTPESMELTIGGKKTMKGELPWHAGIYRKTTRPYEQICGGSLISTHIVLSAAHCFCDGAKQLPAYKFAVAVGKIYRPWDDKMDDAQQSDVKQIHIPTRYQGIEGNYQEDIAVVIVTKKFQYKTHIRPVCLDFSYNFEIRQLSHGKEGKAAGWGLTAANSTKSSLILQVLDMPYVDLATCLSNSSPSFRQLITSDKICAGTLKDDTGLCKGDSGGGLVFSEDSMGVERYYLRGVVSTSATSEKGDHCNTNTYVAFTSISKHDRFIQQFGIEKNEFACRDGSYVSWLSRCDGTEDCADGSDEAVCSRNTCSSSYLFRCAYGACIDKGSICNEITDCADGSDEDEKLCSTQLGNKTINKKSKCSDPLFLEHGNYTKTVHYVTGDKKDKFNVETLTVNCDQGYSVTGNSSMNCYQGYWPETLPSCDRHCRLDPHPSVEYRCYQYIPILGGYRVCNTSEPVGTVVTPVCRTPNYYSYTTLPIMHCQDDKHWDEIVKCVPECGKVTTYSVGEQLVIGKKSTRGELPWHALIYNKRSKPYNPYMYKCGGNLISTRVVLSVAHCFNYGGKQEPASRFAVAVGKIYRPWDDKKDDAQKSDVKQIHIPPGYQGREGNYQEDIAVVIVTKEFQYKNHIRPVCLDFDENFENRQLYNEAIGKAATWGLKSDGSHQGHVSLQVVDMLYVNAETCLRNTRFSFREIITSDKICAATLKGNTTLCEGDSASGLVFEENNFGVQRYYLRGMASTVEESIDGCKLDSYITFSSISGKEFFIKKFGIERGEFLCQDGGYISSLSICDGTKDCADGSDETVTACSQNTCSSSNLFRCTYGACIDKGYICNNITDCADGSDEDEKLCSQLKETKYTDECLLPPFPEHGNYTMDFKNIPYVDGDQNASIHIVTLTVTCDQGYAVIGQSSVKCYQGYWHETLPSCVPMCVLEPHPSVEYRCLYTDNANLYRVCNFYEPIGTDVSPICQKPDFYFPDELPIMRCQDDSQWNYVAKCSPECGKITPEGKELVIEGVRAKKGELPWHTGIYTKDTKLFTQICGGSLISNNLVISAAHCFWTESEKKLPASKFAVAVGKIYRSWNDPRDEAQTSDVKEVHIPERYEGIYASYQDDIAVVIVETSFVYKPYVRPVCLHFDNRFDKLQLQTGNKGKVAGWGPQAENGELSTSLLQVLDLPTVDVETCIDESPKEFLQYITSDKFCAGDRQNNLTLCKGDSGGGLAFPATYRGVERHYLRGVVSTAPRNDDICNTDTYTSFTQIIKHADFIKKYMT